MSTTALQFATLATFVVAFFLASMGEYWTHRLMHLRKVLAEVHREHHKKNTGQGVLGELIDYYRGGIPGLLVFAVPLWLFVAPPTGVAFLAGGLCYGAFAAYAHQLQHENPGKCFWMKMPVHYVHHKYNMWHHNFGIGVDIWDRAFGTYKVAEWQTSEERAAPARGMLHVKWV